MASEKFGRLNYDLVKEMPDTFTTGNSITLILPDHKGRDPKIDSRNMAPKETFLREARLHFYR